MAAPFSLDWLSRRPFRDLHPRFRAALGPLRDWPAPEHYDQLVAEVPRAPDARLPRFVTERRETLARLGGYEQQVAQLASVPTRPANWHDFFNMTVWAHFPGLRWALNSLHVDPNVGPKDPRNGRAPAQNLAATLDEAGMLVVSSSRSLLDDLQALRFKRVFWERRHELAATTCFSVVGHGMLEALLEPHAGLAARSLLLHVPNSSIDASNDQQRFALDALAAARVQTWRSARGVLDPVPMLAIPGFCDNDAAEFYDDARNLIFEPISRRSSATALQ